MTEAKPSDAPSDANEGCVGPSSEDAGKSSACDGCPSQKACSSGKFSSPEAQQVKDLEHGNIKNALSNIRHVILVLSGKGGTSTLFLIFPNFTIVPDTPFVKRCR
jgi:positive regulator of sigma E activity